MDAQAAREGPDRSNPGRLGLRGGMLRVAFHLLSLFHLLVCPAGQEKAAATGCPRPAGPRAGLAGHVGSVEDLRASPESGNASLFSPLLGSSDSEGNFETPEAETPTRSPLKEFCEPPPGSPEPEAGNQGKEPPSAFRICAPEVERQGGVMEESHWFRMMLATFFVVDGPDGANASRAVCSVKG